MEVKHKGQTQIFGQDSECISGRRLGWRPEEYSKEEIYGCGERGHEFSWREMQRTG